MARKNDFISQVDKYMGNKIFQLRLGMGLSRQQLAEIIGVTHQQLQKYEKGVNRISVGRLALISKALDKEIKYFYEDFDSNEPLEENVTNHQRMCIELSRNFMKIKDSDHQTAINTLVKSLSKEAENLR
jgi:transcriptional regulator with XRE-family HTH domain